MCLKVYGEVVVLVAEADIVCYKVLTCTRHSPYRNMLYPTDGWVATSDLDTEGQRVLDQLGRPSQLSEFFIGLHSFANPLNAEYEARDWHRTDMTVWQAVIPKGSRYIRGFFNSDDGYMSDTLKLVKVAGQFNGFRDDRKLDTSV